MEYFIKTFEKTVKRCWDKPALDEFRTSSVTYGQLAADIEKIHLSMKAAGLNPGDKIAINARSSANWAKIFMASVSGGYVAVELFNGFTAHDTQALVNHSDSRLLFTEKLIFKDMDFAQMPQLLGVIDLKSGELLAFRDGFDEIYAGRDARFAQAHPDGMKPEDVNYPDRPMDDLCGIMYTSGSTGFPKGVMLTVRNFSANVDLIPSHFPYREGENYVSVLPYAHIFGLTYDMVTPLCTGMHLVILYVPPVPSNLKPALREFRPKVFFAVPLILRKMIDESIGEFINSKTGKSKLAAYDSNPDFCEALRTIFISAMGGNIEVFVTGGAAIPDQIEQLLAVKLATPFVTGYGMTECAPTISLGHVGAYKLKSVGEVVTEHIEVKIDSKYPTKIAGEVLVKGDCVFAGYYKNQEATDAVFTEDGWFRTGDLGTMDKEGTLFLVGRSKSMILSSNGQNIYPEEIEVILNNMPFVAESLIASRNEKLVALIVPDQNALADAGTDSESLVKIMDSNLESLNKIVPAYSVVSSYEIHYEPFAKTPKGSIKRFLYV
ncbi:MAG: AMP-binding protein [Candidatus Cryptobacteroides sp.]|nr:AMP-binding protein [Bacteroidales bacterium]